MSTIATVSATQRFTPLHPCPICGGHKALPNGHGQRCWGFRDGDFARCTRPEFAHDLPQNDDGTYSHYLAGPCRCGETHGAGAVVHRTSQANGPSRNATPPGVRGPVREAAYEIRDRDRRLLAVHRRRDFADGSKDLWWQQPDGQRGLAGRPCADLPPYRAEHWRPDRATIHVEGEKAADALAPLADVLSINVLGHVTGAPASHSADALRSFLSPQHLLWPDADDPGETQMRRTADTLGSLLGEAGAPATESQPRVRRIIWPMAPAKGDAADWVANGGSVATLKDLVEQAPEWDATAPQEGQAETVRDGSAEPWGELQDLPPRTPAAPTMPAWMIPEPMREWLVDSASRNHVPLEMPAVAAVIAAGGLIGNTIGIRPGLFDDFTAVPNLWGAVVARPGWMKSESYREPFRPVRKLIAKAQEEHKAARTVEEGKAARVRAELKAIERRMALAARDEAPSRKAADNA